MSTSSNSDCCANTAIIDSGATQAVHNNADALKHKKPSRVSGVRGVSGKRTTVDTQGVWSGVDTLLMPSVDQAIISVGQYLDTINEKMIFTKKHVYLVLRNSKKRIRIGARDEHGLYQTCVPDDVLGRHAVAKIKLSTHAQVVRERVNYLHRCLGHISKRRMAQVIRDNHFTNLTVKDLELLSCCDSCHTGNSRHANRPKPERRTVWKRKQKPRKPKTPKAPSFGHTIVADSTSRQPTQTPSGKRYANVMTDVYSRWTWTTLLRSLKETLENSLDTLSSSFRRSQKSSNPT